MYIVILYRPNCYDLMSEEQCPFKNALIVSKLCNHTGGVITIKEYAVKVTIPSGAIDINHEVEVQVVASLFGPFTIPKGYRPISAYVWIKNCYEFKKPLQVEIEHHAYVSSTEDISNLCVLKTCEHDRHQEMHEVTHGYHFEVNSPFCIYYAYHFCSVCLATNSTSTTNRVMAYHVLPNDYESADQLKAELIFCYDLEPCRKRTEDRISNRNMLVESVMLINDAFNNDELFLNLDQDNTLTNWKVVFLKGKVEVERINFRLYSCEDELLDHEKRDVFPPRCIVKVNCHKRSLLDIHYTLYVKVKQSTTEVCKFNIFIKEREKTTALVPATLKKLQTRDVLPTYDELLAQKPKMQNIMKIVVPKITACWKDVSRSLCFEEYTINGIEAHGKDAKEYCEKIFSKWLNSNLGCSPKTWNTLICCIKEVEDLTAATEKIEEGLQNLCTCTNN